MFFDPLALGPRPSQAEIEKIHKNEFFTIFVSYGFMVHEKRWLVLHNKEAHLN